MEAIHVHDWLVPITTLRHSASAGAAHSNRVAQPVPSSVAARHASLKRLTYVQDQ
jgi:hypothetical protein